MRISAVSQNESVLLSVETVPMQFPGGTVGDHWHWEVMSSDGMELQQDTSLPELSLSLAPKGYGVTVHLEDETGMMLGGQATTSFEVTAPDVTIQVASEIMVEVG